MNNKDQFEKNLKYLKTYNHQRLASSLENISKTSNNIKIIPGKRDGLNITYNDINLLSSYDPIKDAQRNTGKIKMQVNAGTLFTFLGFGMGYEIALLSQKYQKNAMFLIYDFDIHLFYTIIHYTDLSKIFNESPFFIFIGVKELKGIFQADIDIILYAQKETIIVGNYKKVFSDQIENIQEIIIKNLHINAVNQYNDIIDSAPKYLNSWNNIGHLLRDVSINNLFGRFKNIPGILVSAGPSLDNNISFLKELQDYCLIIACDSAFYSLMEQGITPHFIITADVSIYTMRYFIDHYDNDRSFLIYEPMVNPGVFQNRNNKGFVMSFNNHLLNLMAEIMDKVQCINAFGSISCAALILMGKFGIDPIIVIGQDCCFYKEQTHCSFYPTYIKSAMKETMEGYLSKVSSIFANDKIKFSSEEKGLYDIYGNSVFTNNALLSYSNQIREIFDSLESMGNTVYNASEGGLLNRNLIRLEDIAIDILSKYKKFDFFSYIGDIHKNSNSIIKSKKDLMLIRDFMDKLDTDFCLGRDTMEFSSFYLQIKEEFSEGGLQLFYPFIKKILIKYKNEGLDDIQKIKTELNEYISNLSLSLKTIISKTIKNNKLI